jgi:DNA replication and repair protein RecF
VLLTKIDIERFRCLESAQLEFNPRCNVIVGTNGSGKTSLLEAVFLLGSGHSFRSHQTNMLLQHGADSFQVVGKVGGTLTLDVLGVLGRSDSREFWVNGRAVRSAAELAIRLPVQVIDPEVHRLIEDGPNRRRQFFDWGVFHVEPQFHDAWRRYSRALRQRNAALRNSGGASSCHIWDQEIIEQGIKVANFRDRYLEALKPFVCELSEKLIGSEVVIEHQRGWRKDLEFEAALTANRVRDAAQGNTSVGPHRADLVLKIAGVAIRDRISRGEQKMLACVLILSQQLHRASIGAPPACLLLDDPAAELDVDNLGKLLSVVAQIPAQLIVTTLSTQVVQCLPTHRLFHVEHGNVKAVA